MPFRDIYRKIFPYLGNTFVVLLIFVILSLPFFNQLNSLILDRFQKSLSNRPEIVIIGIDDESLKTIGAWPWNRDILAKSIDKLNQAKASAVGVDVVFYEKRNGDEILQNSLNNSKIPIVLGNKILDGQENRTIFDAPKVTQAYTNIIPDQDGKVRQAILYQNVAKRCIPSLSFEITKQYFRDKSDLECGPNQKLGPNLNLAQTVNFNYSQNPFKSFSFSDLYNDKINPADLSGKIVLIGVTASDLKSSVSDNFVGINGQNISGVELNANIINSILQNRFQTNIPQSIFLLGVLLVSNLLIWLYKRFKSDILQFIFFLVVAISIDIGGLFLFDYGYNWPLLQTVVILASSYIYFVILKYLTESRQNSFLKQAFSRYINPKLLAQLLKSPESLALGGTKRNMTVMFSDIRGFTTVSEKLDPQTLINIINKYLECMCQVILDNNGTIDKFIGDAIMAFWNAPLDDPKHQIMAIKTALEMQVALDKFNQEVNQDFKIGVGVNTGDMVVGNVGSNLRFDYTVLGDNVNLGSRIEGLTKKYGITTLLTESVLDGVEINDEGIIFRIVDEVIVKGKSKAIKVYEPLLDTKSNQELKSKYELAFKAYQEGNFSMAVEIWASLKTDKCSQNMIERANELISKPKIEWNGIWKWEEK